MPKYSALLAEVANRGTPPVSFLDELIAWARTADDPIFAPNDNPRDIYATIKGTLGPWQGALHRRAVLCEVMRVHAGFESSWNWNEGVDRNNHHSLAHVEGQETGIFQVSYDSLQLDRSGELTGWLKGNLRTALDSPKSFIDAMKTYHAFALEYYARLVRVSVAWAGPIKSHKIDEWLSSEAVAEFELFLA